MNEFKAHVEQALDQLPEIKDDLDLICFLTDCIVDTQRHVDLTQHPAFSMMLTYAVLIASGRVDTDGMDGVVARAREQVLAAIDEQAISLDIH